MAAKLTGYGAVQDEASNTRAANEVPDAAALNAMLARGPEELARFNAMDADPTLWLPPPRPPAEIPHWLRYDAASVRAAVVATSKQRPDQVITETCLLPTSCMYFRTPKSFWTVPTNTQGLRIGHALCQNSDPWLGSPCLLLLYTSTVDRHVAGLTPEACGV